jgi:tRNA pseudouridine55 synthase
VIGAKPITQISLIGGLLRVDKSKGPSSHRAVAIARKALGTRDVGHAGTLDPLASGVLVLGVAEGLKLLRYIVLDDKRYRATVVLGSETSTLDTEGEVTARKAVPEGLDVARVQAVADRFVGAIEQQVPEISAVKQGGTALYKRARRGEKVDAPVRSVVVHALSILAVSGDRIELEVSCGKGFYVRSLARDLAYALDTVGHVGELRRLQSGEHTLEHALPLSVLERAAQGDEAARAEAMAALIAPSAALPEAVRLTLSEEGATHARHGRAVLAQHTLEGALPSELEPILLLDAAGTLLALARRDGEALRIVRGIKQA